MQIIPIAQLLSEAGFARPDLGVLNPNHENYSALLFQPEGDIEAATSGVRNANGELASRQYAAFLRQPVTQQSALVITPEYSPPGRVIEDSLRAGIAPAEGALWVLGCKSIPVAQLNASRDRASDITNVLYEPLVPQ